MDWENKHFHKEIVIPASHAVVVEAIHRFAGQSIPDWTVSPTPEGFDAHGRSGMHHAVAHMRLLPAEGGTKIAVELLVKRSNGFGQYMLVDIGNYYDNMLGKWLWAIFHLARGVAADPSGHAPMVGPPGTVAPHAPPGARVFVMDAYGKPYLGVVREHTPAGVLVAYDEGGERWVPATAAHVVERRENVRA